MGDVRKQKAGLKSPLFMQSACMKRHARTTSPEKQIPDNIAEGQSVSIPVQFVSDAEDVFSPMWLNFFVVLVLSDPVCWDPFLLLYLVHLAYPQ